MAPGSPEDDRDDEAEAWLARARPTPSDEVVRHIEERVVGRTRRRASRSRVALAGLGFSGSLAAVIVVVALAGGGPKPGNDGADADEGCVTRQVTTTVRQGQIVAGPDGQARVVTTPQTVTKAVKRCP